MKEDSIKHKSTHNFQI